MLSSAVHKGVKYYSRPERSSNEAEASLNSQKKTNLTSLCTIWPHPLADADRHNILDLQITADLVCTQILQYSCWQDSTYTEVISGTITAFLAQWLQSVQNVAVRLITCTHHTSSQTSSLSSRSRCYLALHQPYPSEKCKLAFDVKHQLVNWHSDLFLPMVHKLQICCI